MMGEYVRVCAMLSKYSILELEKSDFPVTVKYLGREASGNAAFAPRASQLDSAHRGLSTKVHTEAFLRGSYLIMQKV